MDDKVLAHGIANVRDAVQRIREFLPDDREAFSADRTAREVVILNLFVALQHSLSLAAHWLAQSGRSVPDRYRDIMLALADQGLVEPGLAARLAAASGLRNLIAHRYGVLDNDLIHETASTHLDDLLELCDALAATDTPD